MNISKAGFRRPADFDAIRYMRERMPFVQSDYQIDVWIDMPPDEAQQMFAPWRIAMEPQKNGTRLRCGRDRLEMFAAMLLSTGKRIVVNSPADLRVTFKQIAKRAMQAAGQPRRTRK